MEELRDLIQTRLDELGWSQAELARRSGVAQQTINSWMTSVRAAGSRGPSPDKLRAVAEALGLPVIRVFEAAGRTLPPAVPPEQEAELLAVYRELAEDDRKLGLDQLKLLLQRGRRT